MITLRHTKFPKLRISIPGGVLVFDNYTCTLTDDTAMLCGKNFFDRLLKQGCVTIEGELPFDKVEESSTTDEDTTSTETTVEDADEKPTKKPLETTKSKTSKKKKK